ncbi:hypothetical protein [Reinekea sp. G2M2-21]|uniref:hypothetical protein n=1 Tax=Reinekea sp. G2M2-21 TaxID=2788942 RepID=UPI0018AB6DC3|nr:hypothetical protein [Reinekea sp. G2M2-21]
MTQSNNRTGKQASWISLDDIHKTPNMLLQSVKVRYTVRLTRKARREGVKENAYTRHAFVASVALPRAMSWRQLKNDDNLPFAIKNALDTFVLDPNHIVDDYCYITVA